jgi:HK97 family phage major capsid protein
VLTNDVVFHKTLVAGPRRQFYLRGTSRRPTGGIMPATVTKANAKKLREQRADLIQKAQKIVEEKSDDQGLLSSEDQTAVDTMLADADKLNQQAKSRERLEVDSAGLNNAQSGNRITIDPRSMPGDGGGAGSGANTILVRHGHDRQGKPAYKAVKIGLRGSSDYHEAYCRYLSGGRLSQEQQEAMIAPPVQGASLQTDNPEQAGYLVASEQFATDVLKAVDDTVWVRQYANVRTVITSKSLGIRCRTSKASTFAWGGEITAPTGDTSLKYGRKVLEPHYMAGEITVSRDLLRLSVVSADQEVRGELARDGGELQENAFFTGNGAQQPLGLFIASTNGISTARDAATGSATGFTAAALISSKYKLKEQYRNGGLRAGARWGFHRDSISLIAQLTDTSVGFLMRPGRGLQDDDPDTLLGFPIHESEFIPNTLTSGKYVGILGNFRYYEIADALDMEVLVLVEVQARQNQVVYLVRMKCDGLPTLEEAFVRLKTN